jgi:hypothetical protein
MWEAIAVIAFAAAALLASAVALSYRRFADARAEVLAYLKGAAPEISIEALTDTGFRARVLGAEIDVDLATLLRQRVRGTPDRPWLDQVLAGIRARVPSPAAPPFALVRDRIVPQVKPASYVALFEHYPEPQRLVWRPLAPGIAVTYVIAGVHQTTAVTRLALAAWATTPDDLHTLAIANLRAQTRHLLEELGGPRARYEHLDGFDATRILTADLVVPGELGDPLLAIPEESVLLIGPASARESLQAEAAARCAAAARPLSARLFRFGPDGPVLVEPG